MSSKNGLETWISTCKRVKLDPLPYTKINSKYIKHLKVSLETVKLPQENRKKSSSYWSKQLFLGYNTKNIGNKSKNKHLKLHQMKKFLHKKEKINRVKKQPMKWEKVFANYISDKGLISKLYKEFLQQIAII